MIDLGDTLIMFLNYFRRFSRYKIGYLGLTMSDFKLTKYPFQTIVQPLTLLTMRSQGLEVLVESTRRADIVDRLRRLSMPPGIPTSTIPFEIAKVKFKSMWKSIKHLRSLILRGNDLRFVDAKKMPPSLRVLDLGENRIQLTANLSRLSDLGDLRIDQARLKLRKVIKTDVLEPPKMWLLATRYNAAFIKSGIT